LISSVSRWGENRTWLAVFKVLYLLTVTAVAFAIPAIEATRPARWLVVTGLLLVQVAILVRCGVEGREIIRPPWRLKWLFVVLLVCYAFLPSDDRRGSDGWQAIPIPFVGVDAEHVGPCRLSRQVFCRHQPPSEQLVRELLYLGGGVGFSLVNPKIDPVNLYS
jgi:hypothetical protein